MTALTTLEERKAICSILRNLDRDDCRRILEDAIADLRPDGIEAEEILQAIYVAIRDRYEDRAVDALEQMNDAREALEELYNTHGDDPLNPFNESDEAYRRRQAAEAI